MANAEPVVVHICPGCRPEDVNSFKTRLRAAIDQAGLPADVRLEAQACLNVCEMPVSIALQARGRATYLFSGVDPAEHLDDIVATLGVYMISPQGWIEDATACGELRHRLVGRVPAHP